MPLVHLLHWGDSKVEYDEISAIRQWWRSHDVVIDHTARYVPEADAEAALLALRGALEDADSQVVYFACHASRAGFSFLPRSDIALLSYERFRRFLKTVIPQEPTGRLITHAKWLVLGACGAMEPETKIERHMPELIPVVVGFQGLPKGSVVSDLAASVLANLCAWRAPGQPSRVADGYSADNPARFLAERLSSSVAIASRNPDSGAWGRIQGRRS